MTECARCGDCCDPVLLSAGAAEYVFSDAAGVPEPGGQREWARRHLHFRRFRGEHQLTGSVRLDAGVEFDCGYFDKATRQCTAYDDRPAMCRDYPFYGRQPQADSTMGGRCSFLADVPGIRMLPVVAVSRGAHGRDHAAGRRRTAAPHPRS